MKLVAIVIIPLLFLAPALAAGAPPEGRSEAPVGQITWAVHTTLVPTYFDPAETTIITSFMEREELDEITVSIGGPRGKLGGAQISRNTGRGYSQ